ncbi:MAG: glutathione S-transferase family protein [Burkholderiaceae bacterium]
MNKTIRIHSFPLSGHAHRVELFANIAGINHEIVNVDLATGEHKTSEFLKLNPLGQVPVIEDGEVVITDSNAILVYLARRYAPAYLPQEPELEAQVQRFLTLAAGAIAFGPAAARRITLFNAPLDVGFCLSTAENCLKEIEHHMAGREFLVGDAPTIADFAIYSYTAHAPEGNISLQPFPLVRRLLARIEGLDGFKPMQSSAIGLAA